MDRELVYVVHSDPEIAGDVCNALLGFDYKVVKMTSESEAEAVLSSHQFVLPDAILTPLGDLESGDSILIRLFNSNPLMEQIPLVVLAGEAKDERRRALRMGLLSVIFPPYDDEEINLTTKLAIEKHRSEQLLFGSLSQLSVPDLLQTAEVGRRSGTIIFQHDDHTGQVWMRDGAVINAEIDGVFHGEEGIYSIVLWQTGTFEANFGPVDVAERFSLLPSELLLEAMRRLDEGQLAVDSAPAVPMPEDAEGQLDVVLDLSLVLLNVAASYALNHMETPLVESRCERARKGVLDRHPAVARFKVTDGGQVALQSGEDVGDVADVVSGVARWLSALFTDLESALAWRFSLKILSRITASWRREMEVLGFVAPLNLEGFSPERDAERDGVTDPAGERMLPFGAFVVDDAGLIERCSSYGSRRFRFDPVSAEGQPLSALVPPNLAERLRSMLAALGASGDGDDPAVATDVEVEVGPRRLKARLGAILLCSADRFVVTLNRLRGDDRVLAPQIHRDAVHGALTDGGAARIVAANDDFFRALDGLFARTLRDRHHALLHRLGKKWGLRHVLRIERFVQREYSMTLREVESQMAIELMSESVGVLGLGHCEVDLDHRDSGVVIISHRNSPFPAYAGSSRQGACSILAGFYAALLSYLSGRQLAATEVRCGREPVPECRFVVATEDRLSRLLTAVPGSSDYMLLTELGARTATPVVGDDDETLEL